MTRSCILRTRRSILLLVVGFVAACASAPEPDRPGALEPALSIETPEPLTLEQVAVRRRAAQRAGRGAARAAPVPPAERRASPPAGGPFRYSFEQLRTGDVDMILTGAGPLWTPEEQQAYHETFAEIPPYIIRLGVSIVPSARFSHEEVAALTASFLEEYAAQIPHVTIKFDMVDRDPDRTARGLCREVLDGELDQALRLYAAVLRDAGRPVFVRIGPEINGPWNNYDPALFPQAYRYIADFLAAEGCDQIIREWNLKYVPDQDPEAYFDFYPGDDYVDWWGLDLFSEDFRMAEGRLWVRNFLDRARAHGKPVIIPESCPNGMDLNNDRTWNFWFQPYFDLINGDANIKGFCYSNRDFGRRDVQLFRWGDMRIDQSALAGRWREELSKPQYLKADPAAGDVIRRHYAELREARRREAADPGE